MTDDELRALLAGATPGPWRVDELSHTSWWVRTDIGREANWPVCHLGANHPPDVQRPNAALLAAAPDLAAEVLRLRAEVVDLACDLAIEKAMVALLKGRLTAEVERCPPGCDEPHGGTP